MQDLTQARREAFCRYIAARGGRRAVIAANSLTVSEVSYLSQLIGVNAKTVFGERAAKNWEQRLGMQGNPLLFPHETRLAHPAEPASVSRTLEDLVAAVGAVPPEDRMAVIGAVSALISNPTAARVAEVVSLISDNVALMRARSQQMERGNATDLRTQPAPALA